MLFNSVTLATLISAAAAQSPAYGQCGGQGWSGSQSCVSGYTCKAQSEYYSQCLPGSGKFPSYHHENTTDHLTRWQQPSHHSKNHHQIHIISSSRQHRRLIVRRQRKKLLSILHAIRLDRHLGQRQLPDQVDSLRFLHTRLQRRRVAERFRCRSSTKIIPPPHHKRHANNPSTGRRRRSWLRHLLEAHDPERQLRPPGQQRGQQHRRHGHQPVPGARQPAVLAVRPLWNEPVWCEPQLRSLHRFQGELCAVRKQWRGLGRG